MHGLPLPLAPAAGIMGRLPGVSGRPVPRHPAPPDPAGAASAETARRGVAAAPARARGGNNKRIPAPPYVRHSPSLASFIANKQVYKGAGLVSQRCRRAGGVKGERQNPQGLELRRARRRPAKVFAALDPAGWRHTMRRPAGTWIPPA